MTYGCRLLLIMLLLPAVSLLLSGCGREQAEIEIFTISDAEGDAEAARVMGEESIAVAEGFEVTLWAPDTMLKDPVALDMDDLGRAWVTVTNRRSRSEFNVRSRQSWMTESLGLRSVEEKRAFIRRELSPENSAENSRVTDHNGDGSHDWRDLTVLQEEVYRLEDVTGNGMADQSQLFFRDFNEEITDLAGSALHYNGATYVTVGPDLWRLEDTNGDGMGDRKESISHGYNIHAGISGHGMSGLRAGPDGRIYWSVGDHGLSVVDREGKRWFYPTQGAILRSEPDGSNFEVFAAGLRNTHEFDFDKYGNLITVDHDGDFDGELERLVYIVDGSDSGWRTHWQFGKYTDPDNNSYNVWMDEGYSLPAFENQTAHILPPIAQYHAAPAGMTYNPGTALSARWNDHFFITSFPASSSRSVIYAFTLEENGASFELGEDESIVTGILATGLDVGPDGAIYFTDWIQGWGPNGKGRIWKLDTPSDTGSERRLRTESLLKESFEPYTADNLTALLVHDDMRVRQKAQFELANRDDVQSLQKVLENSAHQLARIHAIWGIGQVGRREPDRLAVLQNFLNDEDPEIVSQVARTLGDNRFGDSGEQLLPLLDHNNARVRFFAAEALGRIRYQPARAGIVEMLRRNNDEDLYLRHAGSLALSRIGNSEFIAALSGDPSRAVRSAAVIALKRMGDENISLFLQDSVESIVTDAARAINDDQFIEGAVGELAQLLEAPPFVNEPLIRRAINANLYSGSAENAEILSRFSLRQDIPDELRSEAIRALSVWPEPSELDRVTGRYRGPVDNNLADARSAMGPIVDHIPHFREKPDLLTTVIEAVGLLDYRAGIPAVFLVLEQEGDVNARIAALGTLKALNYERMEEAVDVAMSASDPELRAAALSMLPSLSLEAETVVGLLGPVLETGSVEEKKRALEELGSIQHELVYRVLEEQIEHLIAGNLAEEIQLELLEAVESLNIDRLNRQLEAYQISKPGNDIIAEYRELLYGGDAEAGRELFYQNSNAMCVRCHTVGGQGSNVGPDLGDVGSRLERGVLLLSMIDPTADLTPGYGEIVITLEDGDIIRGRYQGETDEILTVDPGNDTLQTINKAEIRERINLPSAMPVMTELLSRRELRDLVEYLTTLTSSPDGQQ